MVLVLSASVTKIREVAFGKEGSPQSLIRQNFRKTGYYQSYLRKSNNLIESELSTLAQSLSQEISLLASDERSAVVNAEKILEKLGTQDFRSFSNRIDKLSQVPSRKGNFGLRWLTFRNYFFFTLSAIYKDMKTNPLNPKVYTYVIAVCTLSIQLRNSESIGNIIIFTCVTGLITFVLQSLNVLYWKQSNKQFFLVSQLILLTNIGLIYVARDYSRLLGTDLALRGQTGRFVILLLLLFSATYILGHLGNAGVTATVDLFRVREFSRATERIEEEMLQDHTRLIGRKWAVHIHGKIQTRISAAALAIKQAVAQNDSSALMRAVSSIQSTLAEPSAGMISIDRNLKSEIEARCAPWQGLVDYKLTIEPNLESLTGSQVRVAGDVVEEVISNAARHGGATKLEIKFSTNKRGDIDVLVEDNSVTPPPEIFQRGVGLGATIFAAASFGRWSLERDNNRGITVFKIKISPDANFDFEN
jgi:two-component sensor histidine kinase